MKSKVIYAHINIISQGLLLLIMLSCEKADNTLRVIKDLFTDPRDNNVYETVTIGNQTWLAENLKYLPLVAGPDIGSGSMNTNPYYYVYDYYGTSVTEARATNNYNIYGVLYNWLAANEACPSAGICPARKNGRSLLIILNHTDTN